MSVKQAKNLKRDEIFIPDPPDDPDKLDEYAKWIQMMDKARTRAQSISGGYLKSEEKDDDVIIVRKGILQWWRAGVLIASLLPVIFFASWAIWDIKGYFNDRFTTVINGQGSIIKSLSALDTKVDTKANTTYLDNIQNMLISNNENTQDHLQKIELFQQKMDMFMLISFMSDKGISSDVSSEQMQKYLDSIRKNYDEKLFYQIPLSSTTETNENHLSDEHPYTTGN